MNSHQVDLRGLLGQEAPVTWLFCGDSITQGARHTRGYRDYTQLFKERTGEIGRNEDVVINTAVGGWGTGALEQRLEDRIMKYDVDAVFFMFGTNDAVGGTGEISAFEERYARILEAVQETHDPLIVLQTTVPMMPVVVEDVVNMVQWDNPDLRSAQMRRLEQRISHLQSYVSATARVSAHCRIPLVDHWATWLQTGSGRGQLLDGGFHPNEYGHRLIAHTLFKACDLWDESSWTCRLAVPID